MKMEPKHRRRTLALAAVLAAAACGDDPRHPRTADAAAATPEAACEVVSKGANVPEGLTETSGLTESRRHPGVYWSHNDSGRDAAVFAVGADGRLLGQTAVNGATNHDWEDIASGPCPDGGPACLYIADTGNNDRDRDSVSVWVFPEPEPGATSTAPAQEFRASYPDHRTDIEAMAVLPDGRLYLVSKGNNDVVQLFRWPTPLRAGSTPTLQVVRQLAPRPEEVGDRVTGASASPDGRFVAVRTYAALALYRTQDLLGSGRPFAQMDLDPLAEPQGEAVSLANDGTVVLTSEGPGSKHIPGTIARLRCSLPR
ncbi:MAG TPA: hypothetical protein VF541_18680 [Longimicrobium sp.]